MSSLIIWLVMRSATRFAASLAHIVEHLVVLPSIVPAGIRCPDRKNSGAHVPEVAGIVTAPVSVSILPMTGMAFCVRV